MSDPFIVLEWFFESSLLGTDEQQDRVQSGLTESVWEWINDTHRASRQHLDKHPRQKSVGSLECFDFVYAPTGQQLSGLRYVVFHRGSPIPDQCLVYIGGRDFILKKGEEIKSHLVNETKNRKGTEAFIVEQQLT